MSIEHRCFAWHLLNRDSSSIVGEEKAEAVGSFCGKLKTILSDYSDYFYYLSGVQGKIII